MHVSTKTPVLVTVDQPWSPNPHLPQVSKSLHEGAQLHLLFHREELRLALVNSAVHQVG